MLGCDSFGCDGVGWPFAVLARGLGLAGFFFGRPISGIPSWGLVAVDGLTAFRLPGGGSLSVAGNCQVKCKEKRKKISAGDFQERHLRGL